MELGEMIDIPQHIFYSLSIEYIVKYEYNFQMHILKKCAMKGTPGIIIIIISEI